jgi:hypothetical protein
MEKNPSKNLGSSAFVHYSSAPRSTVGQRNTCTHARHLYFFLPLIKPHNKTAHQGARHYDVIKVNILQVSVA